MKAFFWKKLNGERVRNSVWNDISNRNGMDDMLDLEKLTELFTVQDPKKKKAQPKAAKKADGPRSCLPAQRSQNIGIVLSFLKLNAEAMANAVLRMDAEVLTNEALEAFSTIIPTDEEVQAVQRAKQDRDLAAEPLPVADAYVDAVSAIPRLQQRVTCWQFTNEWAAALKGVRQQQETLRRVEKALINSRTLQELLAIILRLGNILNAGNFHGGAHGFSIENLANLETVKAADGVTTLLDYLVMTVDEKSPELLTVLDELGELMAPHMKNIAMRTIQDRMAHLSQGMKQLQAELEKANRVKDPHPDDRFVEVMQRFSDENAPRLDDARREQAALEELQLHLCDWFGEEKNAFDETVFMGYIATFLRRFDTVHKALVAQRSKKPPPAKKPPTPSPRTAPPPVSPTARTSDDGP
jgi:diaphanous 1